MRDSCAKHGRQTRVFADDAAADRFALESPAGQLAKATLRGGRVIDTKELEAFYWAATLKGFARAAERLNTSQPTVSARIAALESRLGIALFDRSGRDARLTPRGMEMLAWSERILATLRGAEQAMTDRTAVRGVLRLGVSETVVHLLLPRLLKRLQREFPHLVLELEVDVTPVLRDRLVARELDLALLLGPVSQPAMNNRHLVDYDLAFFAAPALALGGRRLGAADIASHALITYPRHTRPTIALIEQMRTLAGEPRLIASPSLAANVRLGIIGAGIAVLPSDLVRRETEAGELEALQVALPLEPLRYTATWPALDGSSVTSRVVDIILDTAATDE